MKHFAARTLSVFLALLMMLTLLPVPVKAETALWQIGTVNYYSTGPSNAILTDSYFYSDQWFFEDPAVRNDALALVSMQLTAAAVDDRADGLGSAFLSELGFDETGYVVSDPADPAGCNFTWGKKTISDGDETAQLVAIQIQSYTFDQNVKDVGWTQNFYVNGEMPTDTHFGLSMAANTALSSIAALGDGANVKFWVTGQSRGGAVANLVSAALGGAGYTVYGYTFEAPAVVEDYAAEECAYIHNYLCTDDIVTMVPPWGMTRNGDVIILNTEEINASLPDELLRMGSELADSAEDYLSSTPEANGIHIMNVLTTRVPAREDYSAVNTDTFADEEGNEIEITYVYQDLFIKLVKIIFGGGIGEIDVDALLDNFIALAPAVADLVSGVRQDTPADYYNAAKGLDEFLAVAGISLPLTVDDLYVLLKLAGPALVDVTYETENDPLEFQDILLYLAPGMELILGRNTLVFSHHFDTLIARLKYLVPPPTFEELDILIDDPEAGDDVAKAPAEIGEFIRSLEQPWLDVSAAWETEEDSLEDDRVTYLSAELRSTGYAVPDDFSLTLNGAEPIEGPSVSYDGGTYTIKAKWAFTLGSPEKIRISFDTAGRAQNPEPLYVDAGSRLGFVLTPETFDRVINDDGTWQFDGWFDVNGQTWTNVVANEDLTLLAKWTGLIDKINLTFRIPHVGEEFREPLAEDNAHYYITDVSFIDEDWRDITTAADTRPVSMSLYIKPVSENFHLPYFQDESEYPIYDGTVTMNGENDEQLTTDYNEEDRCLVVYYKFNPLPADDEPTPADDEPTPTPADDEPTPTPAEEEPTPAPTDKTTPTPTDKVTPTPTGKAGPTPAPTGKAGVPASTNHTSSTGTTTRTTTEVIRTVSDDDGKETTPYKGGAARTTSVKTGDENDPALWLLFMVAAAGVLLAMASGRKKEDC